MRRPKQYSGIVGIAVLWSTVITSLVITQFDVFARRPISYLGVFNDSKYFFNIGLISASVLLLFFLHDLSIKLKLSKAFIYRFVFGQLCQILVALTPFDSMTVLRPIHVIAGFGLAATLPITIWLFSKTPDLPPIVRRVSRYLYLVELGLFTLGISWFILASRAGAFSEIVTAVAFDVWIVIISMLLIRQSQ